MHVIHGTWIPDDSAEFTQEGGFYLWVETDAPAATRRCEPAAHPRHLAQAVLAAFLLKKLGLREYPPGSLARTLLLKYVLLPTAAGRPLPSFELLRYVDEEIPLEYELAPWPVWCYRVPDLIATLNDIHFIALHAAEDFQLGADIVFWHQYTQALKGLIARDQYIPSLRYPPLAPAGKRAKSRPDHELYHGWEFLSATYEAAVARYAAAMPAVCAAGANNPGETCLFAAEPLLRHFSECLLHNVVVGTPYTAKLEQQTAGTILYGCLFPYRPEPRVPAAMLDDYRHWLAWRAGLTQAHTGAGFTLCFRLEEAPPTDVDTWQVQFLVAARHDPSFQLSLADYWARPARARTAAARPFGRDFEKNLLLALGYAARIYPTIWRGLATDQPAGCRLTLDEAFAFLKESAWVLEDAGYTVIVPAWWTPEGRRRARIRLKTAARPAKGTAAIGTGQLGFDTLVAYEYQLAIGGQAVSEEEWRQLVEAKTPLVRFRGQWMELNREKMQQLLQFWQTDRDDVPAMTLLEVLKLDGEAADDLEWEHDQALQEMLARLHDKSAFAPIEDPAALQGTLRDYQRRGVAWLHYLEHLGLNPCLADDMGLGKCVVPQSVIAANGSLHTAESLWDTYAVEERYDGEGFWALPKAPLIVPALDHGTDKMVLAPVGRLYRQRVREAVRTVTLADGSSITTTRRHKLLTNEGWANHLHVGDDVCVPARLPGDGTLIEGRAHLRRLLTQDVSYCKIRAIEEFAYEGWVYDFEVPTHHNFVANNILCHNTVQVIAHLVREREGQDAREAKGQERPDGVAPTLLIAPTSVLGNWRREIERFAPHLRALVHQGAARSKDERGFKQACRVHDVVLTSFALARLDEKLLRGVAWGRVVVDEAQNIKNPQAAQTRALLKLSAPHRLALTGTPVENRLRDLWSIFNFLNPGYLGREAQFRKSFELPIQKDNDPARSATLKQLVEPFILRRLKTDQRIIADLPDKIEQKMYCTLTPEQASLYEAVVKDVAEQLDEAEGIGRKGLILSTLLRLKQVCNHPAQFLQDGSAFTPERSHKLQRLGEMAEEVIESGESALVFTQFTEIGAALERYLAHERHYNTYYLHGGTAAARRDRMVAAFQDPDSEPSVFILSLRAGGVGLNLTRANHVFHFDRWWNPAAEDQATDRAFRIGQRKNVFVHKFVALGTLEERIDALIEDKKRLSSLVVGNDESWLTELDNDTFKDLIALRRGAVVG